MFGSCAGAHGGGVGQELDGAVQPSPSCSRATLQAAHQPLQPVVLFARHGLADADRLALLVIVAQHERRDLVGHREQQRIAVGHLRAGRDLDVDLVVRSVDAGRIVERVGVEPPSRQRRLDPAALGEAQVRALADHPRTELVRVDADRIAGTVAGVRMAFGRRLHIGADAAEVEQVDRRRQDGAHQVDGSHRRRLDAQHVARFGRERDRLGGAVVDAAAGRQQRLVVIHPGRPRPLEQPPPLGQTRGRVRRRIDEDMAVVEGRH